VRAIRADEYLIGRERDRADDLSAIIESDGRPLH
jgi:hypothetical protein